MRERIELNPLRAFDSEHEGTRAAMASATAACSITLSAEDSEHFGEVRALLEEAGVAYDDRPDAGAGPGLLHAHGLRVHLPEAGCAERGGRGRALRRPGRAARWPPRRRASAGRRASSGSCWRARHRRRGGRRSTCTWLSRGRGGGGPPQGGRGGRTRGGRRAGHHCRCRSQRAGIGGSR